MGNQSITTDISTALTANAFTRSGFSFAGWHTTASGTGGTNFTNSQSVTLTAGLTLYAKWSASSHVVSFDSKGGSAVSPSSFVTGGNISAPTAPTRTGYTFTGWAATDGGATETLPYSPGTIGAVTLYAVWSANTNTVTFKSNFVGGPVDTTQSITTDAETALTANTFTRSGFSFAGWHTTASGTGGTNFTNSQAVTLTAGLTLYAKWTAGSNTVTFNANFGSTPITTSQTIESGVPTNLTAITASRSGHTLTGWHTTTSGTGGTSYTVSELVTLTAGLDLYAQWLAATYALTFAAGTNGSGVNQVATKTHEINLVLPDSATANGYFVRAGFSVTSWSLNADGSTSDYALGASYVNESIQTLYPVWTGNTYIVTYQYNGADGDNTTVSSSFQVGGVDVILPTPTRTGYNFGGWYSDIGISILVANGGASYIPTAGITLYAKWSGATFTVIYNYSGADAGNTITTENYTTLLTPITLPTPTRTGYTFAGWFTNSALTVSAGAGGATYTPSSNLTVFAKWTAINYSIIYNSTNTSGGIIADASGGSVPIDSVNYNIGGTAIVKSNSGALIRLGYVFMGWVLDADGTGTALNSGESILVGTASINLYPKWNAVSYTISYNLNGGFGSLVGAPASWQTPASNVTLPTAGFTKIGFNFAGWSETQNGAAVNNSYRPNFANATLYAVWTLKVITYSFDQGTAAGLTITGWPANASNNFGVTISLPNLATTTVNISGQSFLFFGWKQGTTTTFNSGDAYTLGATDVTFTAQWVRLFDVRYGFAGGEKSSNDTETDDRDKVCIASIASLCIDKQSINLRDTPTRVGHNFVGWKIQATSNLKAGLAQQTVIETGYLFYAQWAPIAYSMSFNSAGGSNNWSNLSRNIGQVLTLPNPGGKTGYGFVGWSNDSGATLYATNSGFVVGSVSEAFVAQWTPNTSLVSYEWQGGASSTPKISDSYTYDPIAMTLPSATDHGFTKDGFTFAGWSTSSGGTAVTDFRPAQNTVLFAVWTPTNFTLSFDPKGGAIDSVTGVTQSPAPNNSLPIVLPTATRLNFSLIGWYDQATGGVKLGDAGANFIPTASRTLHARWVQNSLFGVDEATLEAASTFTASNSTSTDSTLNHTPSGTSARVQIPTGALPPGTVITVRYFKDTDRQSNLIPGDNDYFFSILVSWIYGSGDSATVPNTAAGKPITVTLTNPSIKAGATIYQIIGTSVTNLGVAQVNGSVVVNLTEDPEIVVASTKPSSPTTVTAVTGDTTATVSWTQGSSGGAQITSYTVTASPGGASCTTATTSCTITGLNNDTAYTFTVTATNSVGTSSSSGSSASVTPTPTSYAVTFNSTGGSAVAAGSFIAAGSVSAPSNPTRSGFTFDGWSSVLNNAATKVTFPHTPSVTAPITLFALWLAVSPSSPGGSGSSGRPPTSAPTPAPTPGANKPTQPPRQNPSLTPTVNPVIPVSPINSPAGSIAGSAEKISIVADAPREKLVASAGSWKLEIKAELSSAQSQPISTNLSLDFQLGSMADLSGTGLRPKAKVSVWVFSEPIFIGEVETLADGAFSTQMLLPARLLPGKHTMQLITTDSAGMQVVLNIPITVSGKVTVGTFKGFLALYTKDLMGQKLSARVAGKWLVQDPITKYKSFDYSRKVRFTGAGYKIFVDLYLNSNFLRRDVITTR